MHGLLMSLKSWTVTMKERERKKSHTASPWGFFGDVVWGHPAGPAETLLLLQNANYLVRGPWAHPPTLPHCPPLYSVKHRGSVKSILGGAIVFQEATVKLEW